MLDHPLGLIFNEHLLPSFAGCEQRLYLVAGASRGGTSPIAYVMRRAGVNFGNVIDEQHEPPAIMHDPSEANIRLHIMDLEGPAIGAKLPAFTWNLRWMDKAYVNAMFFFVIRNPLDIAKSIMKRDPNHSLGMDDLATGLDHGFVYYRQFAKVASELTRPVAVLSHEKILADPESLFSLLADTGLRIHSNARKILAEELQAPDYKRVGGRALLG